MLMLMPVVRTGVQDVDSDGMYQEVKSVIQVFPGDAWNAGKANLGGLGVGYSNIQIGWCSGGTFPRYVQELGWVNC